jgi:hypothetical protein
MVQNKEQPPQYIHGWAYADGSVKIGYHGPGALDVKWLQFFHLQYSATSSDPYSGQIYADNIPLPLDTGTVATIFPWTFPWLAPASQWFVDSGTSPTPFFCDPDNPPTAAGGLLPNDSWIWDRPYVDVVAIANSLGASNVRIDDYFIDLAVYHGKAFAAVKWDVVFQFDRGIIWNDVTRSAEIKIGWTLYDGDSTYTELLDVLNRSFPGQQYLTGVGPWPPI